jgi:hypothetical protein
VAGETEFFSIRPQVISVLNLVVALDMHIMTRYCAGDLTVSIHGKIVFVHIGFLLDTVTKINTMTLTTEGIEVRNKLSLCRREGKPASEVIFLCRVTYAALGTLPMGRHLRFQRSLPFCPPYPTGDKENHQTCPYHATHRILLLFITQ